MSKTKYKKYFSLDSLIKDIKAYMPDFNEDLFRKAFDFGDKAHEGQLRKDGETPYFVHPIKVVEILTNYHADENTLIAALLHDVPEDTKYDIHEVKKIFGEKVSFLIDGITKLSKVHYQHNMPERQVESLRKLFLHSAKDPRVILIKLADRLHNMRTLKYVENPDKRLRISSETLEIYVPMANLLGIQGLKSELEDLCFKYLYPKEYEKLKKSVNNIREKNEKSLDEFKNIISKSFKQIDISAKIYERKQNLYTIYKKLLGQGKTLDDIDDRIAVRVIVKTIPHCYEALGVIHGIFMPKISKFKDYIANPKVNKYQSLHTMVFGVNGTLTEVQIRTEKMHREAEYGIAANFFEKNRKIAEDVRSSWVNKVVEMDKRSKASDNFIEELKLDIFEDRIFIFTPKGKKIDLPRGASAIDFAYAIHPKVGNHAVKAEINNNLLPITTPLKTGDVVNIITDRHASPSLSWLSFLKTNLAKNKIHSYLKKVSKERKIYQGQKLLQKEFDIAGIGLIEKINFKKIKPILTKKFERNFKNIEDLLISIGEGEIKAYDITEAFKRPLRKPRKGIKVNIKVVAKNRFGLLRDLLPVLYKHTIDMTFFKAWTSTKSEDAFLNAQVVVRSLENVGNIFDELEQFDDVKHVYRIPYRILYITYTLALITGILWILHPFIFSMILSTQLINYQSIISQIVIYSGMFLLFLAVIYIITLVKNYVPYIRNKKLLWGAAFGAPILAAISFFIDKHYFTGINLSWVVLFIQLLLIYSYLFITYYLSSRNHN